MVTRPRFLRPRTGPAATAPGATSPAATSPAATWPVRLLTAASAGWLLFCLLQEALTGRAWFWVVPGAAPPPVLLGVPLLVLAAVLAVRLRRSRSRVRWSAAMGVLSLVVGLDQSGLTLAAVAADRTVPAGALHIVAQNTEYWGSDVDPDRFYAYLKAQNADVYLLQEYLHWDDAAGADGAREVDDTARLKREFPGYHLATRGELVTLSRFPIVAQPPVGPDRELRASGDADWSHAFAGAKVLRTDLAVDGSVLSVYNVHMLVPVAYGMPPQDFPGDVHRRQRERKQQFDGLAADVRANPGPLFIAGDFNTNAGMGDLNELRGLTHDAADAGDTILPMSWDAGSWHDWWRFDWAFTAHGAKTYRYSLSSPQGTSDHLRQDAWISRPTSGGTHG
ncbi:endonuclease/exonuclease/phosphatase family protein [Kitasatospora sp. NPDC086801]|uniref:endonuclease/exonuclease/phosphatase family protein n=1 Tax=Kitasatospora sp. NPDC086801 TaxID=3364066 RepID=UPI003822BE77